MRGSALIPAAPLKREQDLVLVPSPPAAAAPLKRLPNQSRHWITPHAVRRYVERVNRRCTPGRARRILTELAERAHFVKVRANGQELWRTPKPERLRLLVTRQGNVLVVESVLFAYDR